MKLSKNFNDIKPGMKFAFAGSELEVESVEIYDDIDIVDIVCTDKDHHGEIHISGSKTKFIAEVTI